MSMQSFHGSRVWAIWVYDRNLICNLRPAQQSKANERRTVIF